MDASADATNAAKPAYTAAGLKDMGGKWIERIKASETREKDWRDDAEAAEKAYSANPKAKGTLYDFNILHSNVETIVPAIYNSTPVPDVRRRWVEAAGEPPEDPTPQILQQAAQEAQLTPEQAQQAMQTPEGQQLAQRALQSPMAQQAMGQFKQAMQAFQQKQQFDQDTKSLGDMIERAIIVQIDDNCLDIEVESVAQDSFLAGRGILRVKFEAIFGADNMPSEEHIEFEAVSWRDFRMGPATRWGNVPWQAFHHTVSRETAEDKYTDQELSKLQPSPATKPDNDDLHFWEIWCRTSKKVYFIDDDGKVMQVVDDPLNLRNFYPTPRLVQPITLTAKMTPVCPFTIYQKLADELDLATKRINKIMKGLKMRGLLAGSAAKLLEITELDDNEISVLDDLEGLAQTPRGLESAILWWPVEQAIKVLQQLYAQREQIKQAIYEITGISDIVRGASKANETLGAQQIKTQWGSLRIQKMQRMIERLVRDVFGLMAEIITSGKFSDQTLQAMTGIEITDGMRQLMQQPVLASYRVDVESDSTVRADLTRVKGEMAEFLQGTAQYFQTMGPLIAQAPQMAEPAAEIYASFSRFFKLGKQAEDALDRLVQNAKQAPDQQQPDPAQQAAQAKMQADQQKSEQDAKKGAIDIEIKTLELEIKRLDKQRAEIELQKAVAAPVQPPAQSASMQ